MNANRDYLSPATEKNVAGIGTPVWSGQKPLCSQQAAFLRLGVPFNGRPGGRSRKARGCSIRSSNSRFGRPPLLEQGLAVQNRNWSTTMQTQAATTPRRRGRPRKNPINPQFPGTVIRFDSRPRLAVGDVVELCRGCLPGNRGKLAVIAELRGRTLADGPA
jgi:hypothetical protein